MFFQEDKIKNKLICSKCKKKLDIPYMLPCGANICSKCVPMIKQAIESGAKYGSRQDHYDYCFNENSQNLNGSVYKCSVCFGKHFDNPEGFPISETLNEIISLNPDLISRGDLVEPLSNQLEIMNKQIEFLSLGINNGLEQIKKHCTNQRIKVKNATDSSLNQIKDLDLKFIAKIDEFEKECIKPFNENSKVKEKFMDKVNELKVFHQYWSKYLKQLQMNDADLSHGIKQAKEINSKSEFLKLKLENIVFNGLLMDFNQNEDLFIETVIGHFEYEKLSIDSKIIKDEQFEDLINVCQFKLNQKLKLIYRASDNGFKSEDFHSKCDNILKTLTIIKSSNECVFGGYTEQDWSGNIGYKSDDNAFIFSLINESNSPFMVKCSNKNAIFCFNTCGPTFGDGHDIWYLFCFILNIV
jgi:hypothetical protein